MRLGVACFGLALVLVGCGGKDHSGAQGSPPPVARGDGVRYVVPVGWRAARRSLTPHLVNPRELLTVGTGPLPRGGACSQFPSAALHAMRLHDVLVTVQERLGSVRSFPARPRRFALPPSQPNEADQCAGRHPVFESHWLEFREGGRGFHVLVAVGRSASALREREALAVLDSLRIAARRPVRIDPDDALPYDDPVRGIHLVHPSVWRLYRQALTRVTYPRQIAALGTFALHQNRPDPDCTPATAIHARPRDGGFLFLFEYQDRNRRALDRIPSRPTRLGLPRSSFQRYECMGPSWMVSFRDGGRAFQAHVYGSAHRRRDALAILDSLRVRPAPSTRRRHAAH